MSTPKFKIGDHVMFKGTLDTDVIEGAPYGPYYALASRFGWWHESLLSLDVPEPKQFATANQVALASEVIQQLYKIAALEKELREANDKIKRCKSLVGEM